MRNLLVLTALACLPLTAGCGEAADLAGLAVVTNTRSMPANAAGATSGIVVDNVADTTVHPQASSIYFTLGVDSVATSPCNATVGVGCAIKLTQSALQ